MRQDVHTRILLNHSKCNRQGAGRSTIAAPSQLTVAAAIGVTRERSR